jgi:hypothetical protein
MRYKIYYLIALLLGVTLLSGCATGRTGRLTRLDDVSSDAGIVVAKFRFIYNGKDVTEGCNVVFDPAFGFLPPNQFILDKSGYVFAKLPLGSNPIRLVIHKSGMMKHKFHEDELTCQVRGGGAINYIGDITFDWHGKGTASSTATQVGIIASTGLIGAAFLTPQGELKVSVESNTATAQEMFRQKFATKQSVTPSLLVVKTRH